MSASSLPSAPPSSLSSRAQLLLRTAGALTLFALPTAAQALEAVLVTSGLDSPVGLEVPPGVKNKLFVVEQHLGQILVLQDGVKLSTPFLDIGSQVAKNAEQGLLDMAFHPDYRNNRRFFVSFTDSTGATVVREYKAQTGNPNQADASSGKTVFGPLAQPGGDHNGGCLEFGPDGMLYLSLGDGGECCNDPSGRAQDLAQNFGKILRFDVDAPFPHAPADNPFFAQENASDVVWVSGLRNPWRFSFDSMTGALWIADVGSKLRDEIDYVPFDQAAGSNFGWNCTEGTVCTSTTEACACGDPAHTAPVHDYPLYQNGTCAVIGGHVYRGDAIPDLFGRYMFLDICSGQFWSIGLNAQGVADVIDHTADVRPTMGWSITAFGESWDGQTYLVDGFGGRIWRLEAELGSTAIYGCGINPSGSLTVLSGQPRIGETVTVGVDNPLGTQSPGALPFLSFALQASSTFPCGYTLPGWSMSAADGFGEVLLDPASSLSLVLTGPAWQGPGSPTTIGIPIPDEASLIGTTIYAQAALFDFSAGPEDVALGLTEGLQLRIAP